MPDSVPAAKPRMQLSASRKKTADTPSADSQDTPAETTSPNLDTPASTSQPEELPAANTTPPKEDTPPSNSQASPPPPQTSPKPPPGVRLAKPDADDDLPPVLATAGSTAPVTATTTEAPEPAQALRLSKPLEDDDAPSPTPASHATAPLAPEPEPVPAAKPKTRSGAPTLLIILVLLLVLLSGITYAIVNLLSGTESEPAAATPPAPAPTAAITPERPAAPTTSASNTPAPTLTTDEPTALEISFDDPDPIPTTPTLASAATDDIPPDPAVSAWLEQLRPNAVMNNRMIINGTTYQVGERISTDPEIIWIDHDPALDLLIFRDANGARYEKDYN